MIISLKRIVPLVLLLTALPGLAQKHKRPAASTAATPSQPIKLMVDATQAPQKILHAQEEIPVTPGQVTLVYPKWIPGEHGPTGPVTDFTGLEFFAGGQAAHVAARSGGDVCIPCGCSTGREYA